MIISDRPSGAARAPSRAHTALRAMSGLALASATAIGSAACEFGRKRLTGAGLDSTLIVSLICLLQGIVGLISLTLATGALPIPVASFWPPAFASAALSAITASVLTRTYAQHDISLCAPYNAGLPVFQFLMTTFVLRDEAHLPPHKVVGVLVVCACSFALARAGNGGSRSSSLLPPGAPSVLTCCAIWSCVTKFDQEATRAAQSPVIYVCYAKLLTGCWAALGRACLGGRGDGGKKDDGDKAVRVTKGTKTS